MPCRHNTKYGEKKRKPKRTQVKEDPSVKICDFLNYFVAAISVAIRVTFKVIAWRLLSMLGELSASQSRKAVVHIFGKGIYGNWKPCS